MRKIHFIVQEKEPFAKKPGLFARLEVFACGRSQQLCALECTYDAVQVTCLACLNAMERTPHATCYLAPAS